MLRRAPSAISLTSADIELFKQQMKEKGEKPQTPRLDRTTSPIAEGSSSKRPIILEEEFIMEEEEEELDPVFQGRAIKQNEKKRKLYNRLGIEESDPKKSRS